MNSKIFGGIVIAAVTSSCYVIGYGICQVLSSDPENFFFAGMMSGIISMWFSAGIYEAIGD